MRQYFYTIDEHGRLWHDGSELTDARFIDFFFRQLRPNTTDKYRNYAFISPCGNETNYVMAQDTPIVFHRISDEGHIFFAATLSNIFKPQYLVVSTEGYLYHPASVGGYGRIGAQLLGALAALIHDDSSHQMSAAPQYTFIWHGTAYTLPVAERSCIC
jgi:hypothetical protein